MAPTLHNCGAPLGSFCRLFGDFRKLILLEKLQRASMSKSECSREFKNDGCTRCAYCHRIHGGETFTSLTRCGHSADNWCRDKPVQGCQSCAKLKLEFKEQHCEICNSTHFGAALVRHPTCGHIGVMQCPLFKHMSVMVVCRTCFRQ